MESCSKRINEALNIRNMKQADLVNRTGIPKSAISQYCSGAFKPKQQRLFLIAQALDVDEAWLMGLDVPMERKIQKNPNELTVKEMVSEYSKKYLSQLLSSDETISSTDRILALLARFSPDPYMQLRQIGISAKAFDDWKDKGILPPRHTINALLRHFQLPAYVLLDSSDYEEYDIGRSKNQSIHHQRNSIRIFEKDGSFTERILTDEQLSALKAFLAVLPDPTQNQ